MRDFYSSGTNTLCITFDNSSVRSKYFQNVANLTGSNATNLFKEYVDSVVNTKKFYYPTTVSKQSINYNTGDFIKGKSLTNNFFIRNGYFSVFNSDAFGSCVRAPVKFGLDGTTACGYVLVRLLLLLICLEKI